MNETLRQLYDRKSVRVYTEREISAEEKNLISHRGRALEKFTEKIKEMQGEKQ